MGASNNQAKIIFGFVQKKMNEVNESLLAIPAPSFPKHNSISRAIALSSYSDTL